MKVRNIPFSPPDITEKEINNVVEVLQSGWITTGPKTKEFERQLAEYLGTEKVVCLNSATAALELALRVLGVGPGDEVIVPAYTYTASCSVIEHVGATPVMVDIQEDHFEMNYDALAEAITEKTKVVIPVELAGVPCDYRRIFEVVESKRGLFQPSTNLQRYFNRIIVVSDCAHAIGTTRDGVSVAKIADFASYSFHAVKNLTTAEGGAVTWKSVEGINDEELYKQYQLLSLHGQTKDALHKNQIGSWEYDIVSPAYKCNMTDIMASIGLVQLNRYEDMLKWRHEIISMYNEAFKNLPVTLLNHHDDDHMSSGHLYFVRIDSITEEKRNEIIVKMADKGVACNVHYKPLPMLTAYKKLGFSIKKFPKAYNQYQTEITLPVYSKLMQEEIIYIIKSFQEVIYNAI